MLQITSLKTVLILSSLVAAFATGVQFRAPGNCGYDRRNNRVYSKKEVRTQEECEGLCEQSTTCRSLNYENKTTRTCQLMRTKVDETSFNLIPKKGYSYLERTGRTPSTSCKKFGYESCRSRLVHVGALNRLGVRGSSQGYIGMDTYRPHGRGPPVYYVPYSNEKRKHDPRVYYSPDSDDNRLYVYANEDACVKDDYTLITLPYTCLGSQYIVYDGVFYCRKNNDRTIQAYDLDNDKHKGYVDMTAQIDGYDVGYSTQCQYDSGVYSSIDMMADESGLYALWGRNNQNCRASLSKINTTSLEIERTWHSQRVKTDPGNAFMVCGRIYFTDHYNAQPMYVQWIWDVRTGNLTTYRSTSERHQPYFLSLPNYNGYGYNLHYNPADGMLYSKSNNYWNRYELVFDDAEDFRDVL